jgi:hypothetical protein
MGWGKPMSLLDQFLPSYQFSERHQTMVRCPPGELLDIIQNFRPSRDRVAETFMSIRQVPARLLHRAAPARHPPSRPFTPASFIPLGRDGDREIAAGLVGQFWRPNFGLVTIAGPAEFMACQAPSTAKLVLGFAAEPAGHATRLTTETRVHCPDRRAYFMFLGYWLVIHLFSGILRRRMLANIRRLAESRAAEPATPSLTQ